MVLKFLGSNLTYFPWFLLNNDGLMVAYHSDANISCRFRTKTTSIISKSYTELRERWNKQGNFGQPHEE